MTHMLQRSCYQTIRFIYFIIQIFLWFHPLVSNITIHIGACFYWYLVQPVGVRILTVNSLDLDIFDWCGGASPTGSGRWAPCLSICRVQTCRIYLRHARGVLSSILNYSSFSNMSLTRFSYNSSLLSPGESLKHHVKSNSLSTTHALTSSYTLCPHLSLH